MLCRFRIQLAALVMLGLSATAVFAGKPVKNPPPPQPVESQVQFWSVASVAGGNVTVGDIYDTNSKLQTVGSCVIDYNSDGVTDATHGILYDPSVDTQYAIDLNTIVSNIPPAWAIRKASAINEVGQIAAYIEPIAAPPCCSAATGHDWYLDQTPPKMYAVPDRDFTSYSLPGDINDWGDIAVRYQRTNGTFGHYVSILIH